jgi:RimJ/RimL family protein N-acetyltransferase
MTYETDKIKLEIASDKNVGLLIDWTLDPVAQGPYKKVSPLSRSELKVLFLQSDDREYFLIRNELDEPIGRFYFRKWVFNQEVVDWELNIIIALENERGKGYGTAVQQLAIKILKDRKETNSIFAYTMNDNSGERRVLEKCGFEYVGDINNSYYKIDLSALIPEDFVLYVLK